MPLRLLCITQRVCSLACLQLLLLTLSLKARLRAASILQSYGFIVYWIALFPWRTMPGKNLSELCSDCLLRCLSSFTMSCRVYWGHQALTAGFSDRDCVDIHPIMHSGQSSILCLKRNCAWSSFATVLQPRFCSQLLRETVHVAYHVLKYPAQRLHALLVYLAVTQRSLLIASTFKFTPDTCHFCWLVVLPLYFVARLLLSFPNLLTVFVNIASRYRTKLDRHAVITDAYC